MFSPDPPTTMHNHYIDFQGRRIAYKDDVVVVRQDSYHFAEAGANGTVVAFRGKYVEVQFFAQPHAHGGFMGRDKMVARQRILPQHLLVEESITLPPEAS